MPQDPPPPPPPIASAQSEEVFMHSMHVLCLGIIRDLGTPHSIIYHENSTSTIILQETVKHYWTMLLYSMMELLKLSVFQTVFCATTLPWMQDCLLYHESKYFAAQMRPNSVDWKIAFTSATVSPEFIV